MFVERRGQVIRVTVTLVNWQQEEPTDRGEGRQLFMDDTSRVSREAQARFCEGLEGQFPGGYGAGNGDLNFPEPAWIGMGAGVAHRPLPHRQCIRVRTRRFELVTLSLHQTMLEGQAF